MSNTQQNHLLTIRLTKIVTEVKKLSIQFTEQTLNSSMRKAEITYLSIKSLKRGSSHPLKYFEELLIQYSL